MHSIFARIDDCKATLPLDGEPTRVCPLAASDTCSSGMLCRGLHCVRGLVRVLDCFCAASKILKNCGESTHIHIYQHIFSVLARRAFHIACRLRPKCARKDYEMDEIEWSSARALSPWLSLVSPKTD